MKMYCEGISFAYNDHAIFQDLSMQIELGQLTSITGPNGIGKSTLIKCLTKIYNLSSGIVYLDGRKIAAMSGRELAKTLGYVPQKDETGFSLSVYETVLIGRRPYIKWKVKREDERIVESILNRLQLTELAERSITTLSGGERQKVAIARALAQEPDILFLDEPTSNLDLNHQLEVMTLLWELAHDDNAAIVVVIHDLNLANRFSDKVFLMGKQGLYASGKPIEVLTENNIREIYGVEVEIINTASGRYLIPLTDFSRQKKEIS